MQKFDSARQPDCALAHDVINRLSAIVCQCDLVKDDLTQDSKYMKRVRLIQEIAISLAEELKKHQCQINAIMESQAARGITSEPA